jgi:YVTN family beta-propeller protein
MRFRTLITIPLFTAALTSLVQAAERPLLPTGLSLDPAAPAHVAGSLPLGAAISPEGDRIALLLCGWREQGLQVMDLASGEITQMLPQAAAFAGIAFSPDGKSLWTSGGNDDSVYKYAWTDKTAKLITRLELQQKKESKTPGTSYPAGLAFSRDGKRLFVAENLGDGLVVIDTESNSIVQRLRTGRYPYGVAVDAHGTVYVSCWGEQMVEVFRTARDGFLSRARSIASPRHPSALVLSRNGARLYVASATTDQIGVIDTLTGKVIHVIHDDPPAGPHEGSTPNALALSRDGTRLFIAEADNNAVAVAGLATNKVIGRVPAEWYPTAVIASGERLIVVNGKGKGSRPNPERAQADRKNAPGNRDYTLGQLDGSVMAVSASPSAAALHAMTERVAKANNWTASGAGPAAKYPPFKHVIYVLKENRTYDQVFGDVAAGDGDASLLFFGADCSPNHRALAARFGLFDRFFVNAEVSAQGHNWSMAAYSSDYVEKTTPPSYQNGGRGYDFEGSNRGRSLEDEDDVAAPSTGYLWDLAARKGITYRNYGNFIGGMSEIKEPKARALKRNLIAHTSPDFPGFNMDIMDQTRFGIWLKDFREFEQTNTMPAFELVWLPNDHTSGAAAGKPTPRASFADNDLALGKLVETVSASQFWRDTVIFVLEDDAQNGPDHVDSHRSPMLVISAYNRPGTNHTYANTTDAIATMEEILGLGKLSKFDHYSRPMRGIFAAQADLAPYHALTPSVPLDEKNPPATPAAKQSALLDFTHADSADDDALNRVLWLALKGENVPYPGPTRGAVGEILKSE